MLPNPLFGLTDWSSAVRARDQGDHMFERPAHCISTGTFTGVLQIVPAQEVELSEDEAILRRLQFVMWKILNTWKGNLRIKVALTKHIAAD